ncbi:MAG TPA: GNAT family N-acetyltransferase [Anaerolineales bacterium]|nr:GNAT family N-acetyltransferase [Anaerolineales bacterium]
MSARQAISISRFAPADQPPVRTLILDGLAGHLGELDPSLNPDLDDIAAHYVDSIFLVARRGGRVVGCGALVPVDGETGEIVRMSVARDARRQGTGRAILDALVAEARRLGLRRLVLETTVDWEDVRRFYEGYGFKFTHEQDHRHSRQAHYELPID